MSKLVSEAPFSSSIIEQQGTSIMCPECKSTEILFDPEMGEQVCGRCGIVLAEKLESFDDGLNNMPGTVQNSSSTGLPYSLTLFDKGLSTIIPYSTIDGNGSFLNSEQRGNMQRMIRWNKISSSNRSHHRNLNNAFSVLLRIRDKLSLSDPVVEKAAYYYRKSLELNLLKGRSINGFVVACVYIACREAGMVRSMEEISKSIDTDHIFPGKCYRFLSRRLKIKTPQIDPRPLLSRIANNAGVSETSLRKAAQMMSVLKDDPVSSGKDPNAMAAAVLYGACLAQGENLHQVQLARAANLSVVTIRKRLQDVRKVFPEVPNGPASRLKSNEAK
jgi:transcription initiation factor TFIIB